MDPENIKKKECCCMNIVTPIVREDKDALKFADRL